MFNIFRSKFFIIFFIITLVLTLALNICAADTVYEDAEDQTTNGWSIDDNDPAGATISNVYDYFRKNRVIDLNGSQVQNSYRIVSDVGTPWNNTTQFFAQWSLKYSEYFFVCFDTHTSSGQVYLCYTASDTDDPPSGNEVYKGLGSEAANDQWLTFSRDLQTDLTDAQPGNTIISVNGFLIKGSGSVDDISLMDQMPAILDMDGDGISDSEEATTYGTNPYEIDTDRDGINDGEELTYWDVDWDNNYDLDGVTNNLLDEDSDNDVCLDGLEIFQGYDPSDDSSIPPSAIYENAEDGLIERWEVSDDDPVGAVIANVYDSGIQSNVIKFSGSGELNSYLLKNAAGTNWRNTCHHVIEWKMKYTESFSIFIDIKTTGGNRYVFYTSDDTSLSSGGVYFYLALGLQSIDGQWHRFMRDLQSDLELFFPGEVIEEVNSFLISGSGRVDDIGLHDAFDMTLDSDGDGLSDYEEMDTYGTNPYKADTDKDGIDDGAEQNYWGTNWNTDPDADGLVNLLDADSDNDGILDWEEILGGYDPADAGSTPRIIIASIDSDKIDENLTDFPVLVHLAQGGSGTNGFDATDLFNELPSYSDRKKFAVYDLQANKCYVEIESWDEVNKEAWLWVKVPYVSSTEDTELKIYYGRNMDDNLAYVGEASDNLDIQLAVNKDIEGTYDASNAYKPCIIKEGGTYKMWYSGQDESSNWRTMYADSPDGTTWSNHQMVIDLLALGTYDTEKAYTPTVIKDGDTYKMWYVGDDGTISRILYAESTNGIDWANHQLVININVEGTNDTDLIRTPSVIKDGDTYYIWYSGYNGTNYRIINATSSDGIIWSNHQMVIDIGVEGTYDSTHSHVPFVRKEGELFIMNYGVHDGSNWRTMYADSPDGINWSNHKMVLNIGTDGNYDTVHVLGSYVIRENGIYRKWYSGHDGTSWRILYTETYTDIWKTPSQNVWDGNFVGVWHLSQTPAGSDSILDSTSFNNKGTSYNMNSGNLVDIAAGKGLYFNGIDERVAFTDVTEHEITGDISIELCLLTPASLGTLRALCHGGDGENEATNFDYGLRVISTGRVGSFTEHDAGVNQSVYTTNSYIYPNTMYHLAFNRDVSEKDAIFYVDGQLKENIDYTYNPTGGTDANLSFAVQDKKGHPVNYSKCSLREVRISKTNRSDFWLKATYYSNVDDLIEYVSFVDTDGDGISDDYEVAVYGTNPFEIDTDGDGIDDNDELNYWGSDWNADYDSDGIINLLDDDSDGDGILDGLEDSDSDQMPEGWEIDNGLDPFTDDASLDSDSDGVFSYIEFKLGTRADDLNDYPSTVIIYRYDAKNAVESAVSVAGGQQ